jgi:hypothetical protein
MPRIEYGGKPATDTNQSRPWLPPARCKSPWPQHSFPVHRLKLTPRRFTSMLRFARHRWDLRISRGDFAASGTPWDRRRHRVDNDRKKLAWGPPEMGGRACEVISGEATSGSGWSGRRWGVTRRRRRRFESGDWRVVRENEAGKWAFW